jgi:hypothetical protein
MLPECFELSLEQEFSIRSIELNIQSLSPEQLREILADLSRQLIVKDNVIRHLIKNGCWSASYSYSSWIIKICSFGFQTASL